ncbi:hypothetical protein [Roseobacter sp.]|uniref:hypothetical protein n=1 Tax=Roseobacter sp. TaxID=1907202 RepID=UPI0032988929
MTLKTLLVLILSLWATASAATQFQSGDWAAAKIGNQCFIYTQRAARDTSGALIFSFGVQGLNAGFRYEYAPWPGDTQAPWDADDIILLEIDGATVWLGDEMMLGDSAVGYAADLTPGFVPEMAQAILGATDTVTVALDRVALGETWTYGVFSPMGFKETLDHARQWCEFDPGNLFES